MVFLVVLVAAVVVLLVVVRAAANSGDPSRGSGRPRRAPRPPQGRARPLAPDDDPEFLRELGRQVRRDDGSPA
ncbi:hypothetical protein [Blastococcus sp. LR1]|uniref:hypothetical protein n=1 Tax=Blastococcus sp. LR1 TaxID=2877000 RepID=UPI001CCDDDE9|nr:hypothetical protein [Blastococcus sp. LR1]MCA0145998.1 hypothetical protein [Blastococcus sp. LR1]